MRVWCPYTIKLTTVNCKPSKKMKNEDKHMDLGEKKEGQLFVGRERKKPYNTPYTPYAIRKK